MMILWPILSAVQGLTTHWLFDPSNFSELLRGVVLEGLKNLTTPTLTSPTVHIDTDPAQKLNDNGWPNIIWEISTAGPAAHREILNFHTPWQQAWFCHRVPTHGPSQSAKASFEKKQWPAMKPFWKLLILQRSVQAEGFATESHSLSHGHVSKEPLRKKHDSTPRSSKMLWIFTDSDGNHCFATQDEYLSHGDVSRGHSRTFYNQSRNLPGNSDFSHTLTETIVLQSRVKHWAMAMYHQTTSGKSATSASTLLAISISQAPE